MLLHLHRPRPPLDRFVELVTYFEDHWPEHTKEKVLPDGAVEIIVDLTDAPKHLYDRRDLSCGVAFRRAWISGMRRDWIAIEAAPGSAMFVIRFRPGGAYPFLGFPVEAITDTVDHLDGVLDRVTSSLRDRVLEAATLPAKMAAIEAWLWERARGRLEPQPVIEHVVGRLFAPAGLRISDLVAEVGYSQRHVGALFRRWVGLSPKAYGSIRRFQQVLGSVVRRPASGNGAGEPDWAEVAVTHGYYDQSHLIHEFQRFAGLTPSSYLASYPELDNYLPLD